MKENHNKIISLFERKISLLVEQNLQYAKFKENNPALQIRDILSRKDATREDIIDLGILLHLHVLQLRLSMYEQLIPFPLFHFEKDLQELINVLHVYERQAVLKQEISSPDIDGNSILKKIPPLKEGEVIVHPLDNSPLYEEICAMLGEGSKKLPVGIPRDVVREMQEIDLKNILNGLPHFIARQKFCTVRNLSKHYPVFENDRRALAVVFSEVLFLASEGKVRISQLDNDIRVASI